MAPTRGRRRLPRLRRRDASAPTAATILAGVLAAAILAGLLATGVFVLTDDPAPSPSPTVTPMRVTSGNEIATGFAVGRDRVVTVAHVVDGAVKVDGIGAGVLRVDRRSDLALLAVPGSGGRSPAITAADAGDEVRVLRLRNRRSSARSVRVLRAIVAHVRAPGAVHAVTRPALELGARVRAGDSGAPVLSGSGALVGVIFATSNGREDTAYAVDASAAARLLARD
jgi:S1-C subfamily serine protease